MTPSTANCRTANEIRRTEQGPRPIPPTGVAGPIAELPNVDVSLANGLRVIAVRQPATPMVEIRLWIPFAGWEPAHPARAELLAASITTGCENNGSLAPVGGSLVAEVTPERLLISGQVLTSGLSLLLETVAHTLTSPEYVGDCVLDERRRLTTQLQMLERDAAVIARRALQRQRFGKHPAAAEMSTADAIAEINPKELRDLHKTAVVPRGATLVLVGDIDVDDAVSQADRALRDWTSSTAAQQLTSLPVITGGPLLFMSNEEAQDSQIRLSAQAVGRTHPKYPAVVLANLTLGGYFASRLAANLHGADKLHTYHAHSYIELHAGTGSVVVEIDATTEATAEVLNETRYELARLLYQPPGDAEVAAAREYALGAMHFASATQAGLAAQLVALAGTGLGMPWLLGMHSRLVNTSPTEITQAAQEFLTPVNWTGTVVANPSQLAVLAKFCAVTGP
ncbi:insulinase family protein [Kibdelosporangium philippinense]|uniref:Insulinase family protein n=1 Tax=Kibdelosporangium philippinense TaxID=211113 RepID=A0ABS8ZF15_9PSEU|nr:pitrilysin family protein [Kibdelosporangium philippinense]MCE7006420.1 insulinase family protein [Kibdelosporangium philippinense]